jgi:hypothetical protein
MKFVASIISQLARKSAEPQADIFDQRLAKMTAPNSSARNRRSRSIDVPSAFRATNRQAMVH